MAEVDDRRRESSPEFDLDPEADSAEWHQEQIDMQRLARPTDKQKVADFVRVVEKAFQYFEFKDFLSKRYGLEEYAKYDSRADFARTLDGVPSQMNKFRALSTHDLAAAIEAHISPLHRARLPAPQHHNEDAHAPSPPKDPVSTLLDRLEKQDFYAFSAPTFRAVFLSRNQLYHMDLCPKKELQKIKSSPGYHSDYVIFDEPAEKWSEKGANAAIVVKKYEEACNKYKSLVLGLSREVKAPEAPKEGRKKYEEACDKYKSPVLGLPREVKAPKEGKMSDKKRKREQYVKEGGKHRRVQKSLRQERGKHRQKGIDNCQRGARDVRKET